MRELLCIRDKIDNLVSKSFEAFELNISTTSISLISRPFNFWSSYATNPAV